jgi:hypothetical protein
MPLPIPANIISSAAGGGPNIVTQTLAGLGILPPQWGVFDSKSGKAVVVADTVTALEYRKDWSVSDYIQERGAFTSYNKVASPFDARVMFASGGSLSNRQALLKSVKAIAGDLKLYDIVTPEETYLKCNVTHVDYRRANGKAGSIELSLHLIEIRETDEAGLSNTKQPGGTADVNGGQVQPTSPTTGQKIAVDSALSRQAIAAGA